jgi:hypothetical protein
MNKRPENKFITIYLSNILLDIVVIPISEVINIFVYEVLSLLHFVLFA